MSHPHTGSGNSTTAAAPSGQGTHPQSLLLPEESVPVGVSASHFATMECESPPAAGLGQSLSSPAHGGTAGTVPLVSTSSRLASQHHYHTQLQPGLHGWSRADAGMPRHASAGIQPLSLPANSGVVLGGVVINQPSGHSYLSRIPRPSSSSTSSSSSLHHVGLISPSSSTMILGGAVYDASAIPLQRTMPHFDSQQVMLSSSSSSLSSSNLPVELSNLVTIHSDSSQSLVSIANQNQHHQHRHAHIQQPTLITSPALLMGPSGALPLSQMGVGIPADLISASGQPVAIALSGYSGQYTAFPQQTWTAQPAVASAYPFNVTATATAGGPEPATIQRTHSASDRGDDSPMVGVCIQQSPVASH